MALASSLSASDPSNSEVQTASRNARLWDGSCLKQRMFLHLEVIEGQAADLAGGEEPNKVKELASPSSSMRSV